MKTHIILPFLVFLYCVVSGISQQASLISQLPEEEREAIEAIALYPEKERASILIAATHPEILVRMQSIRMRTETEFQDLLSDMPREDQEKLYNLLRYSELTSEMTQKGIKLSRAELDFLLSGYQDEVREDAEFVNREHFDRLKATQALYEKSERAFQDLLSDYPESVQNAYLELRLLPEVVSTLNENMSMTVLLGDIYRNNPDALKAELDSVNVIAAEERVKELNDWKQQLEENPEAMYEYEQASKEFADEQGYDDEVYTGPIPDRYREDVYVHHIWRPYPYWFGWPSWYAYEIWYPYPWWYHWGYYYGPGNVIIIAGLPSRYFLHWHFYQYRHFYRYPHFTNQVFNHYYGPRRSDSSIRTVVRRWQEDHRTDLPDNWFDNDGNRVERIREYGKFKIDHQAAVEKAVDKAPSEREYLQKHADRYPTLKPVLQEKPEPARAPHRQEPKTEPVPDYKPDRYQPGEKVIDKQKSPRQEEIDRAKENHQNIWERIRRERTEREPVRRVEPSERDQQRAPQRTEPARKDQQRTPSKAEPVKKDQQKTQQRRSGDGQ